MGIQINRGEKVMKVKPEVSFFDKLLNFLTQKSPFIQRHRETKHQTKRKSFPESVERKMADNKKRKRKIAYASRRVNRIRAK